MGPLDFGQIHCNGEAKRERETEGRKTRERERETKEKGKTTINTLVMIGTTGPFVIAKNNHRGFCEQIVSIYFHILLFKGW